MSKRDKPAIDWEAIEREYRAGQLSNSEIGRQRNVSEGAIRKRAKAEGWTRDLSNRVRQSVQDELVRESTNGGTKDRRADSEIVREKGLIGAEVVRSHRQDISQLRGLTSILATRLSQHLDGIKTDGPGIGEKESASDMLEKLTRIRSKLIPLERQAFNLDAAPLEPDGSLGGPSHSNADRAKAIAAIFAAAGVQA